MNITRPGIVILLTLAIITHLSCRESDKPKTIANKSHYDINTGDTFQVMFHYYPSVGEMVCWLNEAKAKSVILTRSEWIPDGPEGCIGCDGNVFYTFKGTAPGIDTIKMEVFPIVRDGKSCADYPDSLVSADHIFIVKVR